MSKNKKAAKPKADLMKDVDPGANGLDLQILNMELMNRNFKM